MLNRIDLAGGAVRYQGATASVYLHTTRNLIDTKYTGTLDVEFAAPLMGEVERRMSGVNDMKMLVDLSEMKDFTAEFRNLWVDWFRSNQHRVAKAVFLQRSALVRIGLTIVGVALRGKLEAVSDPEKFETMRASFGFGPIP